jgi:hypothetical protein
MLWSETLKLTEICFSPCIHNSEDSMYYGCVQVIRSLSGPPNYWDRDRIENNMFRRYKRKDLDGTLYDAKSIMHYR